jgi:hypothetical protein
MLISSGCAASHRVAVSGAQDKVMDAYLSAVSSGRRDSADFIKDKLKLNKAFGYVAPYVPVIEPADVRLVWIPAHKSKEDKDTLVAGHWIYVMLREPAWFIDSQKENKVRIPLMVPYKEGTRND